MNTKSFPLSQHLLASAGLVSLAAAGMLAFSSAPAIAAKAKVNGNLEQTANLDRSPVTSAAIGNRVKAETRVNDVSGDVEVRGNLVQRINANRSPITSAAIGNRAEAVTTVNSVRGGNK